MQRSNRANNAANPAQPRPQQRVNPYSIGILHHIKQSWPSVLMGILGLVAGIVLIVWNEARAVRTTKAIEESIASVTEIFPDEPVNKAIIGKPIYVTGSISVQEPLTEIDYGVSVSAVKLKRRVQMFQWVEEESQVFDSTDDDAVETRYFYYTAWKDKIIDSSSFANSVDHWNPKGFPIKSQMQVNENVYIGNYILSFELKNKFSDFVEITSDERPDKKDIKLHSGLYYHSQDLWNPEVGDIRIQFSYAGHHGDVFTIVGQIDSTNTIVPYKTKLGLNILLLRSGYVSVEDIFAQEHAQNRRMTWFYRGGAWFLLYLGSICITQLLTVLMHRSRLVRDLLPTAHTSLKMTLSTSIFLLVTALAWMWWRPMLGMSLVATTIVMLFVTKNVFDNQPSQNGYNRLNTTE